MGAVARRVERAGAEYHLGTGKAVEGWEDGRVFEEHAPDWGDWDWDGPIRIRFCRHRDCDLMDVSPD